MDLREFLAVIWKRRWLVALVVALTAAIGVYFAVTKESIYESRATIAITPDVATQGFVPSDNLSALLGTYAETVESETVLGRSEALLGRPLDADISSSTEQGTGILRVFARASSPASAKAAASAVAKAFVGSLADDKFIAAEIVDPAATPTDPVQPRPPLIVGTAIVVGFGAGALVALLTERFRRRVESPADLTGIAQLPLVGQIPRTRGLARSKPRIVWEEPSWVEMQESFRSLRTNLRFIAGDSQHSIQVTSATEAQGKSTVVANLGVAFAQIGVYTAILDADLRRPAQHEIFNLPNRGEVWAENPRLDAPDAGKTPFTNLAVFTAGAALADPTTVLHTRFPVLLNALGQRFDLVLVDSAPLLPVSDARIMAPWVDGMVLVLAAGQERPASIRRAIGEATIAGVDLKGYVLNQASEGPEHAGYYRRPDAVVASIPSWRAAVATPFGRGAALLPHR